MLRYYWNVKLCESLYTPLQNLEIVPRNAIDNMCFKYFDDEYWFRQSFFKEKEMAAIDKATATLVSQRKSIDSCRIVAELNFGYWTSLFNEGYEIKLFRPVLASVFPNSPRELRKRASVSRILNDVRRLRNRVFHYEPIWDDVKLLDKHNNILELMYWINSEMFHLTRSIDDYHEAYRLGTSRLFDKMSHIFV